MQLAQLAHPGPLAGTRWSAPHDAKERARVRKLSKLHNATCSTCASSPPSWDQVAPSLGRAATTCIRTCNLRTTCSQLVTCRQLAYNLQSTCKSTCNQLAQAPDNLLSWLTRKTTLLKSSTVHTFTVATSMSVRVWKRVRAAETLGHSHTACHSESTTD